ncbi:2-amino-4-hydroxy-6-hydroxymethyldihydropteridine diphosphokinase [Rhodocytophaga aerolata]|uniref:2-amino-4-hydroxy-6-hydroxymethyldihydropteridine pyrophosphokinase n=1 Tax=Rhodocytophaga aerolata TaxID=455078 RepID=A0ABT8RCE5_9BACT|nr:2-amino-4-hydroxy-6-hydroxymethyldihydropteridine diphosphokinase [Rhodocytophaga aerolata]MDO1448898.1 2-amino-4-hydroxy-6-hydroxymethyldihydropteridine diphosphokinase [Rhodocytophaga aerolata]
MANLAYLLLGTNLGNKHQNLLEVMVHLSEQAGRIIKTSSIYETMPWGVTDQPAYWNQVLLLQTTLLPQELLQVINSIEKELGRERRIRWEARIIDIDILYFNDQIIETETLSIPHPRIASRRFTLVPLAEIAPQFVHPVLGKTNQELLEHCSDKLAVSPIEDN